MRRSLAGFAAGAALLLSLYACSSAKSDASVAPDEAGTGDERTSSADGANGDASPSSEAAGDSALDGANGGDAPGADAANDAGAGGDAASDADAAGDAAVDATVDAGPPPTPVVSFIGRFDTTPAAGPKVGSPGASIVARFSGTEVKATFADEMVFGDLGPSRWEVFIDSTSAKILDINRAQTTYPLASGLPMGTHTVELVKLTEAQVGISQFMGFDFNGGTLLAPPAGKTRHIEFVGDSASNGYGIQGAGPNCPFSAATQNASKAYPALVAKALSADHHNLSASGRGLYWNFERADPAVSSVLYPRTLPFTMGSTWSFASYTPDVVWMTLGGNDYDQPAAGDPAPPFASFQAKYDEMVALIRTKHPYAHIFCAVAPSLSDGYPVGYNAYTNVKTAASNVVLKYTGLGDAKIYYFEFTRSTNADVTGCDGHPNVTKHRAMADEAIVQIKAKTLWP
jgi:lysophospholipase L1-like esterase